MLNDEFLRPRLCGARFEGGAIPLDVLGDIRALGLMLVEVAKWVFLQENPGRQRSPKGFTESVELVLIRIEDGSAVPVIGIGSSLAQRSLASPQVPFPHQRYFEAGRDRVVSAIVAADTGDPPDEHLPQKCLSHFDRVGRSLRDGEAIELSSPSAPEVARLTRDSRRALVLASARKDWTEPVQLRGLVPEADQEKRTFSFQLLGGRRVSSPMPDEHVESILEAFNGYSSQTKVLLDGIGRWNRQQRLVGIVDIRHLALLDPLDVGSQLEEFRGLKDGWLDGGGSAPLASGLDWLEEQFGARYPDELPLPYLCPTEEGGVHAEWSYAPLELGMEIDLVERKAVWYGLNLASDDEGTRELDLTDEQEWAWFAEQVRAVSDTER